MNDDSPSTEYTELVLRSCTYMANWTPGRSSPTTGRDRAQSGSTEVESQRSQVLELAMAEGDSKGYFFFAPATLGLSDFFRFLVSLCFPSSAFSPVCAVDLRI